MTVEQEIKDFTAYKNQIKKVILYLTKNKQSLDTYLLVKPYKYVLRLGAKYAKHFAYDPSNPSKSIWFIDWQENPDWSSAFDRQNIQFNAEEQTESFNIYSDKFGILNDSGMNYAGSIFFKLAKDDFGHAFVWAKLSSSGTSSDRFARGDVCSMMINVLKVYVSALNLWIGSDKADIINARKARADYKKTEQTRAEQINSGKYSWDKIFN